MCLCSHGGVLLTEIWNVEEEHVLGRLVLDTLSLRCPWDVHVDFCNRLFSVRVRSLWETSGYKIRDLGVLS